MHEVREAEPARVDEMLAVRLEVLGMRARVEVPVDDGQLRMVQRGRAQHLVHPGVLPLRLAQRQPEDMTRARVVQRATPSRER